MTPRNTGLIIEPIAPEDYILGSDQSLEHKFGAEVLQPTGNWMGFLPDNEKQAPGYETSACVSFATSSAIEILACRVFNDKKNLSDRYVAKNSGTDPKYGNSPKKVADYIYRNWSCLEADWPTSAAETADEFYAPTPPRLKAIALAEGSHYEFGYEFVPTSKASIKEALKYSPVCLAVPAWYKDEDGKYYRPPQTADGHWTVCYGINNQGDYLIYDTYEPHLKVMRGDFNSSLAMRYHLNKRPEGKVGFKAFLELIYALVAHVFPPVAPTPTPAPTPAPPAPARNLLNEFCKAIEVHEGHYEGPPASRSWRNKNSGNIRCTSKLYYGAIGKDKDGFCVFSTYTDGFNALKQLVYNAASGESQIYKPADSIVNFCKKYAPAADSNDPIRYATFIGQRLGVNPFTFQIKDLL